MKQLILEDNKAGNNHKVSSLKNTKTIIKYI